MDTTAIIRPEVQARLLSIMRIMVGLLPDAAAARSHPLHGSG